MRLHNPLARAYQHIMQYDRDHPTDPNTEVPQIFLYINPKPTRLDNDVPLTVENELTTQISGLARIAAVIAGDNPNLNPDVIVYPSAGKGELKPCVRPTAP